MIRNDDLRYGAEQIITRDFESEQRWHYHRCEAGTDKIRYAPFGGGEGEGLVGGSDEFLGKGAALGFIRVQQRV